VTVIAEIVPEEFPEANVPVVSTGEFVLTPENSNRENPTRVVPEVVTVRLGALSPPVAIL
jgi:hypothetical protein